MSIRSATLVLGASTATVGAKTAAKLVSTGDSQAVAFCIGATMLSIALTAMFGFRNASE